MATAEASGGVGSGPSGPGGTTRHRRRWALAALALAVVVLVLAGIGAASWHHSSRVLVPDRSGAPWAVELRDLAPDRAVLAREEDAERPGVYGLEWPGGNATVGRVLARDEETVTRRVHAVRGRLRGRTRARLHANAFGADPRTARGLAFERVVVPGELGPLPAWRIGRRSRTWAIFAHGLNGDRIGGLRIARPLRAAGLTPLLISYRNDVGAPASPDGKRHMGLTEWRDVEAAARFALRRGARRLVLVGYSMGGALATQLMQRSPLADRVSGLILDAPALDWPATLAFGAREMGLPGFAAKPVQWTIGLRIDADWGRLDALAHADDLAVPTLLFHGLDDDIVPIETSAALARALPRHVDFERIPDAGHVRSRSAAPAYYDARVREFAAGLR